MREVVSIIRALADEGRIRILLALKEKELCVCQLVELLQLAPSTVSKHLSILKHVNLVEERKIAKFVYYRLAGSNAPTAAKQIIKWLHSHLANDERVLEDGKKLEKILRTDVEKLLAARKARMLKEKDLQVRMAKR